MNLQVSHLCCKRQHELLFENLCFNVKAGEALIVEGHNGSGKSTLLRLLAGILTPTAGTITWDDQPIQNTPSSYAKHVHYLSHQPGIKLSLTVFENIQLFYHLHQQAIDLPAIDHALAQLGLLNVKHQLARHLSAGQKRRLALTKLILLPKTLWLLDEPMTSLDGDSQLLFTRLIENHLTAGGQCVISTHQPMGIAQGTLIRLRLGTC